MLNYTKEELFELGAEITTREIYQQPDVWKEAFEVYQAETGRNCSLSAKGSLINMTISRLS